MKQLSFLDFSTDIHDYINRQDITISSKLSKSINSVGFNILMYKSKRLCLVQLRKYDDFIGLSIREPSDWEGIYIPCTPYDVGKIIDRAIDKYLEESGASE